MSVDVMMTDVETEYDKRFDDVDVESILARVERRPLTFARKKRCLYQAPEFVKRLPAEETVEEGTTVSFACKIVGFPKPAVTWFKDDDVIGEDCRAKIDVDENGIHSISLKDVSKCDGGVYKCKASNLEGSSANNLFVSVKARSRTRKKKKARIVACAPAFPAIVEKVAEEKRETLEVELQPESPLTPLYCNISLKSPVSWPAFLGEWAYCMEMAKQDDEDLEMGSEDVFDDDSEIQTSLTFVSSDSPNKESIENICDQNKNCITSLVSDRDKKGTHLEKEKVNISLNANEVASRFQQSLKTLPEIVKRKESSETNDLDTGQKPKHEPFRDKASEKNEKAKIKHDSVSKSMNDKPVAVPPKTLDIVANRNLNAGDEELAEPVAKISVNRSYAKGDSTFSVAVRSSSPFPADLLNRISADESTTEETDSQNKNNDRIEKRLKLDDVTESSPGNVTWDDHVLELILLISGSTFLALCFDLPPWMFTLDVLVVLLIRFVLHFLLQGI